MYASACPCRWSLPYMLVTAHRVPASQTEQRSFHFRSGRGQEPVQRCKAKPKLKAMRSPHKRTTWYGSLTFNECILEVHRFGAPLWLKRASSRKPSSSYYTLVDIRNHLSWYNCVGFTSLERIQDIFFLLWHVQQHA